ncbi:hypothetical protein NC653_033497 [Populus alba x Populus x berolinensis]|uniref:Uncharacterized protein n=1 Tax=Populus alba x Populus x berolinensis TaxID=444605 RepID=A0AAD6LTZ7_9ROSI|nr:hypothetical protein NC653_033497 [Populus alba x Populus x berolinensis]
MGGDIGSTCEESAATYSSVKRKLPTTVAMKGKWWRKWSVVSFAGNLVMPKTLALMPTQLTHNRMLSLYYSHLL